MEQKEITIPIKQEELSDCCAAVAAMLTGTTITEFKEKFGPPPSLGYWNTQLFDYAEKYNLFISDWYEGKHFRGKLRRGQKAYITVVSERYPDKSHAIFWDGFKIYDPHPSVKDGRDIKTYKVMRVVYFTNQGSPRKKKRAVGYV